MTGSSTSRHEEAERRMLELIRDGGLEEPDEVSYGHHPDEVVLRWHETKLAIIVELEEADDASAEAARPRSG